MGKNLIVIILIGVVLTLLVPLITNIFSIEQAFTYDNLVRVNLTSK